jgi:hypothetical protein
MTGPRIEPGPSSSETIKEDASQVEILKKGSLLYTDPAPLARDEGSVYREYVVDDTELSSSSDLRKFTSGASSKDLGRKGADPANAATAATARSSKKKSSPGAKVTGQKSK